MFISNPIITLLSILVTINAFLGLFILFENQGWKKETNRNFFYFVTAAVFWQVTNLAMLIAVRPDFLLFWTKSTFITAAFLVFFLFRFVIIFPQRIHLKKHLFNLLNFSALLSALIISYTGTSNYIIRSVTRHDGLPYADYGNGFLIFTLFVILFITGMFLIIRIKYKNSAGIQRKQIKFLSLGIGGMVFFAIFTDLISPLLFKNDILSNFGAFGTFFLSIFTFYAISQHYLFDIHVITVEILTALIVLGLLIDVSFSKTLLEGALKGILVTIVSYGGYRLVLSVKEEIRRREEIQELTDQLKKTNIRLQELDQLKSEFLSVASHELNSPMSVILGYLHMILYEGFGKVDKNARKYLEKVYFKADLLAKLVRDLLNVSRIEQGRMKIEIKPTDMAAVLKDMSEDYAMQAKEKGLSFIYHPPKFSLPSVLVDTDKLKEIVQNLLSNAVKFTKKGGIDVSVEKTDSQVQVNVKDTGVGIPQEIQKHIGEKFYRADNTLVREAGGTGLGLHLARRYLELMNGRFWFESAGEGRGTTFHFTLPVAKKDDLTKEKEHL